MGIGNFDSSRVRYCVLVRLITPHGDRKRGHNDWAWPGRGCSLPLMGIGNSVHTMQDAQHSASLPLMGIGNKTGVSTMPALRRKTHYPSWGSETGSGSFDYSRIRRTHYPSWGSETKMRSCTAWTDADGSLPLMGIGNCLFRLPGKQVIRVSLPLMGIGNPCHGIDIILVDIMLITPHGDRKPRNSTVQSPGFMYAHYPSWGSETPQAPP